MSRSKRRETPDSVHDGQPSNQGPDDQGHLSAEAPRLDTRQLARHEDGPTLTGRSFSFGGSRDRDQVSERSGVPICSNLPTSTESDASRQRELPYTRAGIAR